MKSEELVGQLLIIIILFLTIISCTKDSFEPLRKYGYEQVVIIPMNGCQSCIAGPINSLKREERNSNSTLFVVTYIPDRQMPFIILGDEIDSAPNVVLDWNNEYIKMLNEDLNPILHSFAENTTIDIKSVQQWKNLHSH